MGENEEKIVYSPAEQQEIERILSYISQETLGYLAADQMASNVDIGIKKSVNLPEEDLTMTDVEDTSTQEQYENFPEEMDIQELAEPVEEEQEEIQDITNLIQEIKEKPAPALIAANTPEVQVNQPGAIESTIPQNASFASKAASEDYVYVNNSTENRKSPLRGLLRKASRYAEQKNPLSQDHRKGGVFTASQE